MKLKVEIKIDKDIDEAKIVIITPYINEELTNLANKITSWDKKIKSILGYGLIIGSFFYRKKNLGDSVSKEEIGE